MRIQTRLDTQPRSELGQALPLKQPYVLLVDPSNYCNLKCRWCPSGDNLCIKECGRVQTLMEWKVFKKIIDDLDAFEEPIRVLRMYKEGEPLLNPQFAEMIAYARQSRRVSRIDTTTNGILLHPQRNRQIINAGINQINISVNGMSSSQIFHNTGKKVDFKEYISNIKDLYLHRGSCEIYIKSIKDILTEEEQKCFFDTFGEISDRIFLERLSPAWPAYDFSVKGYRYEDVGNYEQPVEERMVCPYIFYIMVFNSDGTVSTCVGDWKHHQLLGNVMQKSVKDIWQSREMKKYWIKHLGNHKEHFEMCSQCKVITHGCYDNIDKYAQQILDKINVTPEKI